MVKAAENREHFVYRWYDASGRLLYIGCAVDVKRRMMVHRSNGAEWVALADHVEVESHPTRTAGYAAESRAIRAEQPPFNQKWKNETLNLGWRQFVVVDRTIGKVRFYTSYRKKVEWFLALVTEPRRFIVFPSHDAYRQWLRLWKADSTRFMGLGARFAE